MTQIEILKNAKNVLVTRSGTSLFMVYVINNDQIIPLFPEQNEPLLKFQVRNKSFETRPDAYFCIKGNGPKFSEIKKVLTKINPNIEFFLIDKMFIKQEKKKSNKFWS